MSSEGRDEVKLGSIRDQVSSWTAGDFDDKKTSTKSESKIGPHPLSSKRLIGPQRPVSPYQCTLTNCTDQQIASVPASHIKKHVHVYYIITCIYSIE